MVVILISYKVLFTLLCWWMQTKTNELNRARRFKDFVYLDQKKKEKELGLRSLK